MTTHKTFADATTEELLTIASKRHHSPGGSATALAVLERRGVQVEVVEGDFCGSEACRIVEQTLPPMLRAARAIGVGDGPGYTCSSWAVVIEKREKPKPKPKRISKAQALVDGGLADNLADARAQLIDMGEMS